MKCTVMIWGREFKPLSGQTWGASTSVPSCTWTNIKVYYLLPSVAFSYGPWWGLISLKIVGDPDMNMNPKSKQIEYMILLNILFHE